MTEVHGWPAALHNEAAEQALLGAVLVNNRALDRVSGFLRADHFMSAVHGRIYDAARRLIESGREASSITLRAFFDGDPDLGAVGGGSYLVDLEANTVTVVNVEDFGRAVLDAYLRRQMVEIAEEVVQRATRPDPDAPVAALVREMEARVYAVGEASDGGAASLATEREAVDLALTDTQIAYKAGGASVGLSTGLIDLDGMIGGLEPGQLVVLAARPGMGKTALGAGTIALSAARAGTPVDIYSLEMTRKQVARRHLAALTGVPAQAQKSGRLTDADWAKLIEAQQELARLPIMIDDRAAVSVSYVRAEARRRRRRFRTGLIIVDHLHLMSFDGGGREANATLEIGRITAGLKACAKELDVPVVLLCQLNRATEGREDKRPTKADLRQSGAIEEDADVIAFLYREHYYLSRAEPKRSQCKSDEDYSQKYSEWNNRLIECRSLAEIIVDKNREGEIGVVTVHWDGARTLFSNLERR